MTTADQPSVYAHPLRPADLANTTPTTFLLTPDHETCAAIAQALGLLALRKVRFEGQLEPQGKRDWRLTARLGATVVQTCVVTLAPVTTRIEDHVERFWRADMEQSDTDAELEIPQNTDEEPLGAEIDLGQVMVEALALALPAYPRAEGAKLDQAAFTTPGQAPMTDEEARPFAGLAALRGKLSQDDDGENSA